LAIGFQSNKAQPGILLKPVRTGGLGVHAIVRKRSYSSFRLSVRWV